MGSYENTVSGKIGRLYRAEITNANSLYVLVNAQLLKQWGDGATTLDQAPYKIVSTRDSIYTGIIDSGSKTNFWRHYLPTGGIARSGIWRKWNSKGYFSFFRYFICNCKWWWNI